MKAFKRTSFSSLAPIAIACALLGSACNDTAFTTASSSKSQTENPGDPSNTGGGTGGGNTGGGTTTDGTTNSIIDTFNISTLSSSKVDMLFCVDNSGSMADDQTLLADTFSSFIDGFVKEAVDFHIGIITSDVSSTDPSYWQSRLPGYISPNLGRILSKSSGDAFLMNSTNGLVAKFRDTVKVGTIGSGQEQCLASILAAIDAKMLASGGSNNGFFRDDSLLSFIIVSDEDETITNGQAPEARIQALKDRVIALRGTASRGFRFDFVINKSATKPATPPAPTAGNRPYPEIYYKAAEALAALTYDIRVNFANALLKISDGILNQSQNEFKLSSLPLDPSKIVVKLDGQALSRDAANGFVYHTDRNTIELQGTAAAQAPGQTLVISYTKR